VGRPRTGRIAVTLDRVDTIDRPSSLVPARDWWTQSSVLFVAGKGGVGSTTVSAVLALVAARAGADVLLLAIDGKPALGTLLGGAPLGPVEQVLPAARGTGSGRTGRIRARTVPPDAAFRDYLALKGAGAVVRRAASAASLDAIAASTPGLEHLLVLGKVKELARERTADLIIVDAPPAGHAAPFLRSPAAMREVVSSGPVRDQADEVAEMLADPARAQATLVTLAEETPVNEMIELAFDLEDVLGLSLAPMVVNACWTDRPGLARSAAAAAKSAGVTLDAATRRELDRSAAFVRARLDVQRTQLARLDESLALPRIELPRLATARLGPASLELLVEAVLAASTGQAVAA
jgi:anion-transporting  ArsA/GET3 family ATPase